MNTYVKFRARFAHDLCLLYHWRLVARTNGSIEIHDTTQILNRSLFIFAERKDVIAIRIRRSVTINRKAGEINNTPRSFANFFFPFAFLLPLSFFHFFIFYFVFSFFAFVFFEEFAKI